MPRTMALTSAANPLLRDLRRALARSSLTSEGLCVAESFHLLDEALRSNCEVPWVLAAESAHEEVERRLKRNGSVQLAVLPDGLFGRVAGTETPQGVIALVRPPAWTLSQVLESPARAAALVVVLDAIQDPGNAGAIVRSAEAFGATGVLFLRGAASPFNPKTLRASAGSLFRVPFLAGMDHFHGPALVSYAAMPFSADVRLASQTDLTRPCALVVGSEGRGVSRELVAEAEPIAIPTLQVESLNAAVAASILLYEAHRQRTAA